MGGRRSTTSPSTTTRWSRFSRRSACPAELEKLAYRFHARVHQILRPSTAVVDRRRPDVDAEVVIERGEDFLEADRSFDDLLSQSVGGPDDLAGSHAAARQHREVDPR